MSDLQATTILTTHYGSPEVSLRAVRRRRATVTVPTMDRSTTGIWQIRDARATKATGVPETVTLGVQTMWLSNKYADLNVIAQELALDAVLGQYSVEFATHIPGVSNRLPGGLSRMPAPQPHLLPQPLGCVPQQAAPDGDRWFWKTAIAKHRSGTIGSHSWGIPRFTRRLPGRGPARSLFNLVQPVTWPCSRHPGTRGCTACPCGMVGDTTFRGFCVTGPRQSPLPSSSRYRRGCKRTALGTASGPQAFSSDVRELEGPCGVEQRAMCPQIANLGRRCESNGSS